MRVYGDSSGSDAGDCYIRVGVTGHRALPDDPALAARVGEVVARIRQLIQPATHAPVRFTVLSALAEGADRFVARAILREPRAALHVVLPFPPADYATDFATAASRREFNALMAVAARVTVLEASTTRDAAYEAVGERIVHEADALIALWDGQPARGQGGTANVVADARARGLPLFWLVPTAPYPLGEELGHGLRRCPDVPVR